MVSKAIAQGKRACAHCKVLVVDDHAHIREILCEVLKEHGCHVTTASSGEAALETLSFHTFDVVITDLNMGRVDGIEVLRKVKALSPQTIVIIATGNSDVTYVIEALRNDADDYILKPFRLADLLDRISWCLTKSTHHPAHCC